MYKYEVFKIHSLSSRSYGILAKEKIGRSWITVAVTAPFSNDYGTAHQLAQSCSTRQLSPPHLLENGYILKFLAFSTGAIPSKWLLPVFSYLDATTTGEAHPSDVLHSFPRFSHNGATYRQRTITASRAARQAPCCNGVYG